MGRRLKLLCALMIMGCGDDPPQSPGRFGEVTRFTAGQATVPSSNAVLVDNTGIP